MTDALDDVRKRLSAVEDPIALLEGIFAFAPVGLQIYKASGQSLLVNDAFLRLFGSEPPPEYNVLEDEIARENGVLELIRRAFRGETVHLPTTWYDPRRLTQVDIKTGNRVAIECSIVPLFERAGTVGHVAMFFKDVTAEEHAREEMAADRERLLSLLEGLPEAVLIASAAEGCFTFANATARELLDAPVGTRLLESAAKFAATRGDGAPFEPGEMPLARAILGGEPVIGEEILIASRRGPRVPVLVNAIPRLDREGRIFEAIAVFQDISQRKMYETGYRRLADAALSLAASASPEALREAVARGAREICGAEAAEILLRREDGALEVAARAGREGAAGAALEAEVRSEGRAVGAIRVVGAGAAGFPGAAATLLESFADRAGAALANADYRARLERANRQKDEFLSIAGHELRTPLTTVKTAVGAAEKRLVAKPPDIPTALNLIGKAARQTDRMARLIDELLDVARIDAGRLEYAFERRELGAALRSVVEGLASVLGTHPLVLGVPGDPVYARIDADRIEQVLVNLVGNAARYSERDRPIAIALARAEGGAAISVEDRGLGIAPEDLPHVFDRFFRGGHSDTEHFGGLGLGLYISSEIARRHGGRIEVRSEVGKGSTFTLVLPVE